MLEPVDRLLGVLPPLGVEDAGGEADPVEEDLDEQDGRAFDIAEQRELHARRGPGAQPADLLSRPAQIVERLGDRNQVQGLYHRGATVEPDRLAPGRVPPAGLDLDGGQRVVRPDDVRRLSDRLGLLASAYRQARGHADRHDDGETGES